MNTFLLRGTLQQLSRREFLKLSGQALFSLFWIPSFPSLHFPKQPELVPVTSPLSQGRILRNAVVLYDQPSLSGNSLETLQRDRVYPITGLTVGDEEPAYNRIWYELNGEGFVHSGSVQPVETQENPPELNIASKGQLAEVTVPFTDALRHPDQPQFVAYRLYYSSTYWVTDVKEDATGDLWYHIPDDKWGVSYYVNARHMRLIQADELEPISANVPEEEKRIEVRLESQMVIAYEEEVPVFMTRAATGAQFSDGDFRTPAGNYITNRKRPSRHMAAGDLAAPNSYDLPGVPWVSYLTESGISFHGTYWHNDFGKPRSHGCINLSSNAARWLYRWSTPSVPPYEHTWKEKSGTRVDVI